MRLTALQIICAIAPVGFAIDHAEAACATSSQLEMADTVKPLVADLIGANGYGAAVVVGFSDNHLWLMTDLHLFGGQPGSSPAVRTARIRFAGASEISADLIDYDESLDLALIAVEGLSPTSPPFDDSLKLPVVGQTKDIKTEDPKAFVAHSASVGSQVKVEGPFAIEEVTPSKFVVASTIGATTSGAPLLDSCQQIIGLVAAGGGKSLIATPIDPILDKLREWEPAYDFELALENGPPCQRPPLEPEQFTINRHTVSLTVRLPYSHPLVRPYHDRVWATVHSSPHRGDLERFGGRSPINPSSDLFPHDGSEAKLLTLIDRWSVKLNCLQPREFRAAATENLVNDFGQFHLYFETRLMEDQNTGQQPDARLFVDGSGIIINAPEVGGSRIQNDLQCRSVLDLIGGACRVEIEPEIGADTAEQSELASLLKQTRPQVQLHLNDSVQNLGFEATVLQVNQGKWYVFLGEMPAVLPQ